LAELERVLGSFPAFENVFDGAWKELLEKSSVPQLKEQANLIDTARQAEGSDPAGAIAAYEQVVITYPATTAAELSQRRIAQLKSAAGVEARLWKSTAGTSLTASLVSFDGKTVQLRSSDGKDIAVPLDALSPADQEYLKGVRSRN
jgi:hypothetical protein